MGKPSRLIIVGCGGRKAGHADQPARLYTGSYFTACLDTAMEITRPGDGDRVVILSALHGLLSLWAPVIAPYNVRLGDPGSISSAELAAQAHRMGFLYRPVVALCGRRYADLIAKVWAEVDTPLAGLGIGYQLHTLKMMRKAGPR